MRTSTLLVLSLSIQLSGCKQIADALIEFDQGYGQIVVKDVTELTWADTFFLDADGPGAAAIFRSPPDSEAAERIALSPLCSALVNADYESAEGLSPAKLQTNLQDLTATLVSGQYEITGLIPDAAYEATGDALVVTHEESGATETVEPPAPLGDPNVFLMGRDGLSSQLYLEDNSFDQVVVFVGGTMGDDRVDIDCIYGHDGMLLDSGMRIQPILDAETIAALDRLAIVPNDVIVSVDNAKMTEAFFPGAMPVAVLAGRAFSATVATLTVPVPGECGFPLIVGVDSGSGKVCFEAFPKVDGCMVTTGPCDDPFATYLEFVVTPTGERQLRAGTGLQVAGTTAGTANPQANGVDNLPDGTPVTVDLADFNGNVIQATFQFGDGMVTVSAIEGAM